MKYLFIFFISFYSILYSNEELILTKEEKFFLSKNQPLKVHNEKYWPPYNFNENGKAKGFAVDYINLLAKKLNIKIEFISGPTWNEFVEMLKKDEIDAILTMTKSPLDFLKKE